MPCRALIMGNRGSARKLIRRVYACTEQSGFYRCALELFVWAVQLLHFAHSITCSLFKYIDCLPSAQVPNVQRSGVHLELNVNADPFREPCIFQANASSPDPFGLKPCRIFFLRYVTSSKRTPSSPDPFGLQPCRIFFLRY